MTSSEHQQYSARTIQETPVHNNKNCRKRILKLDCNVYTLPYTSQLNNPRRSHFFCCPVPNSFLRSKNLI